ncbi:hypothetical protein T439DRAFT_140017 [Meredithblackwellia eburnea MCA 4105]
MSRIPLRDEFSQPRNRYSLYQSGQNVVGSIQDMNSQTVPHPSVPSGLSARSTRRWTSASPSKIPSEPLQHTRNSSQPSNPPRKSSLSRSSRFTNSSPPRKSSLRVATPSNSSFSTYQRTAPYLPGLPTGSRTLITSTRNRPNSQSATPSRTSSAENDPFVAQAHRILRPSPHSSDFNSCPPPRSGSIKRYKASSRRRPHHLPPPPPSIETSDSSSSWTYSEDIPLSSSLNHRNSGSLRLLKRSSAVSFGPHKPRPPKRMTSNKSERSGRTLGTELMRQSSAATSISVYSKLSGEDNEDPVEPDPRWRRQLLLSVMDEDEKALKRKGNVLSLSPSPLPVECERFPSGYEDNPSAEAMTQVYNEELLLHWQSFLSTGSPLVAPPTPATAGAPTTPAFVPTSPSQPDEHHSVLRNPPPRSIHQARPRHLPRTTSLLKQRADLAHQPSVSPSPSTQSALTILNRLEAESQLVRVDSEVLSARTALKRLGSEEFSTDALDRLGRDTEYGTERKVIHDTSPVRMAEYSSSEEEDIPRRKDVISWDERRQTTSEVSAMEEESGDWWDELSVMTLYQDDTVMGHDEDQPTTSSPSSSFSIGSTYSFPDMPTHTARQRSKRSPFQWNRGSFSTARTSLSIDALELDLGQFKKELALSDDEGGGNEDSCYVCAWDLIQDSDRSGSEAGSPQQRIRKQIRAPSFAASSTTSAHYMPLSGSYFSKTYDQPPVPVPAPTPSRPKPSTSRIPRLKPRRRNSIKPLPPPPSPIFGNINFLQRTGIPARRR